MYDSATSKPRLRAWPHTLGKFFVVTTAMAMALLLFGGLAHAATTTTDAPADATASTVTTSAADAPVSGLIPAPEGFEPPNPGLLAAQMGVQFWPEYDTGDVLVLLDVTLPATTVFPYTLTFFVPRGARLAGIAEIDETGAFDYTLGTPVIVPGEVMDAVTVTVPKRPVLRFEYYYDPGVGGPGGKSFPVQFQAPADVGELYVEVQQPLAASDFSAGAVLDQSTTDAEGFTFHYGSVSGVKAGDIFQTQVDYTKTSADPSVSSAAPESDPGQQRSSSYLLVLLVVLVVAIGGIIVYRLFIRKQPIAGAGRLPSQRPASRSGRGTDRTSTKGGPTSSRPPHKRAGNDSAENVGGPARFCTECGGRLSKKDRFCSECGAARDS